MRSFFFGVVFVLLLSLNACENKMGMEMDEEVPLEFPLQCGKLTSWQEAVDLMNESEANRLWDSIEIVHNLIGEWGLIGTIPGWTPFETGEFCFKLCITQDEIALEDLYSGETTISAWYLKRFEVDGVIYSYIDGTTEPNQNNRMGMSVFAENVMLGNGRTDDTNTYIYEKIE